jgi:hypothetical protein
MRFRRDRDKPVNVITEDDVHEALQEAEAELEGKSEFVDLDEVLAEAAESEAEYRIELDVEPKTAAEPELGILSLAESIVVGVAAGYYQLSEPTGRSLSLFMDGNRAVLTVYDAEGDYRHIRLDSEQQQLLRSWLDQAAS